MTELIEGPPQRIAVFRALMVGDVLCAVPALRALEGAFPDAEITFIGLPRRGTDLEFPLDDGDREALLAVWPDARRQPYVCVHAGAQLPSRRWDPRRFAEVADAVAARGHTVVLTGSALEAGLVGDIEACMQHAPLNLSGRTTLWTLGALIEGAHSVVCNDTGVSHIAAALGTPSVVVSCGSDPARWAPLDRARHRVLAHPLPCRPCQHAACPTGHECARAIVAAQVMRFIPALGSAASAAPHAAALTV